MTNEKRSPPASGRAIAFFRGKYIQGEYMKSITEQSWFNAQTHKIKAARTFEENTFRGLYLLYFQKEIVYIGTSKNVFHRIFIHFKEGKIIFDAYRWVHIEQDELHEIEAEAIVHLKPVYNKVIPPNSRFIREETVLNHLVLLGFEDPYHTLKEMNLPIIDMGNKYGASFYDMDDLRDILETWRVESNSGNTRFLN